MNPIDVARSIWTLFGQTNQRLFIDWAFFHVFFLSRKQLVVVFFLPKFHFGFSKFDLIVFLLAREIWDRNAVCWRRRPLCCNITSGSFADIRKHARCCPHESSCQAAESTLGFERDINALELLAQTLFDNTTLASPNRLHFWCFCFCLRVRKVFTETIKVNNVLAVRTLDLLIELIVLVAWADEARLIRVSKHSQKAFSNRFWHYVVSISFR